MIDIKKIRTERNLTQQEFADQIGITRELLNKLESGKRNVTRATELLVEDFLKSEKSETVSHFVHEDRISYLTGKNPFKSMPNKEWAVIELLVQEIAVDRSRVQRRPISDCLEELYSKIDLIINGGEDA